MLTNSIVGLIGNATEISPGHRLTAGSATCDGLGFSLIAVLWTEHVWTLCLALGTYLILIHVCSDIDRGYVADLANSLAITYPYVGSRKTLDLALGIGLAICYRHRRHHSNDLWVHSIRRDMLLSSISRVVW
jgi:hypothetical protein